MKEFILRYWLGIAFGGIVTAGGAGFRYFHCKIKEQDTIKEGLRALLRDRIVHAYNNYTDKEFCPIYAREVVEDMFLQYSGLGGNGTVKDLYHKLMKLPTEPNKGLEMIGKRMEFSKKIFIGITLATVIIVAFSCYMIWKTNDLDPLRYLIPAMFTELATATGFYFNKAKAENQLKIGKGSVYDDRV